MFLLSHMILTYIISSFTWPIVDGVIVNVKDGATSSSKKYMSATNDGNSNKSYGIISRSKMMI
jgi:hypothetical protein